MVLRRREHSSGHVSKDHDVLIFGTFDWNLHPRGKVITEGLAKAELSVSVTNRPLGLATKHKVLIGRLPPLALGLVVLIVCRWGQVLWASRRGTPAIVIVPYMGHFDVLLARRRFRSATIVLDHLTGLGETATDRGLWTSGLLTWLDKRALNSADLVLVDTVEQGRNLPTVRPYKVVPVGAPRIWFEEGVQAARPTGPLRIVFAGLFTPLQGATVIAAAIDRLLAAHDAQITMIGNGQERDHARKILQLHSNAIHWIDWLDAGELPRVVASHDISLGIFGTTIKSHRVVPNKVYQGLAAGTAVLTSDTAPQRRLMDKLDLPQDRYRLLPAGDADRLAEELALLAGDVESVRNQRDHHGPLGQRPAEVVEELTRWLDR